ncbi:MAG: YggS family pyridoxal phosphate-dependent enzyme [Kofleriaceae bacterium]|nr:YggS family pyridoxal phosphate-dependent enzyme [Kofleriaceae bacterium]MCB9573263.1 YggS family pyridoxal phosphate-dependent enzyme [Kofleriaceae bacterium]
MTAVSGTVDAAAIAARWRQVRAEVDAAATAAGRAPADVTVVAVSKLHPAAAVGAAFDAGIRDVGENYAQELVGKVAELGAAVPGLRWHYIGKLQRNKARAVVGVAALIHAVDGVELAVEIDRRAAAAGVVQDLLVAVNTGGEASKSGVEPGGAAALIDAIAALAHVRVRGLMTMPPWPDDPEDSRPHFRGLRELRDRLARPALPLPELSMGTTGDYRVAIEEGATLVRVGTAIFGERPARP